MGDPRLRSAGPRALRRLTLAAALLLCVLVTPAAAQEPLRPPSLDEPPRFHVRTGREVMRIADRLPEIREEREKHPRTTREVFTKGPARWQVSYFGPGRRKEIGQVI